MVKITVTVEGEADEVREALIKALALPSSTGETTSSETQGSTAPEQLTNSNSNQWTQDEISALLKQVTANARQILAEVSTKPAGYLWSDLEQKLGISTQTIAGQMSSVGHARKHLQIQKPDFLHRDYRNRQYTMPSEIAQVIQHEVNKS